MRCLPLLCLAITFFMVDVLCQTVNSNQKPVQMSPVRQVMNSSPQTFNQPQSQSQQPQQPQPQQPSQQPRSAQTDQRPVRPIQPSQQVSAPRAQSPNNQQQPGFKPRPIHVHRHKALVLQNGPDQYRNLKLTPHIVPKIRTNVAKVKPALPIAPPQEDSPYIRLVSYDKKHFPKSDPSQSDDIVNLYFDFIKNNDENNCLMRLICQIGFNRTAFGNFGEQVASFFTELPPNERGPAIEYLEAFRTHEKHPNDSVCMQKYSTCQHDTSEMMEVGNELMSKNLTNLHLDEVQKGQVWVARIT